METIPVATLIPVATHMEVYMQLTLAMVLGMLLGTERSIAGKTAGMRTYALVALGSCIFIIVSSFVSAANHTYFNFDPLRVAAGVVAGVGFLGAGLIVLNKSELQGLTSAAGIWVSAGIGIAIGFELYFMAIYTTLLTLFVFTLLWFIEIKLKHLSKQHKYKQAHSETEEETKELND